MGSLIITRLYLDDRRSQFLNQVIDDIDIDYKTLLSVFGISPLSIPISVFAQ